MQIYTDQVNNFFLSKSSFPISGEVKFGMNKQPNQPHSLLAIS